MIQLASNMHPPKMENVASKKDRRKYLTVLETNVLTLYGNWYTYAVSF